MPSPAEIAALLARTQLFDGLDDADRGEIARAMREHQYDAGHTIFTRHESALGLFLVAEGRVRLSVVNLDGRELTFRFVGPGEVMGEIAAFDEGARTADAVAVTAVRALLLPRARLLQIMEQRVGVARAAVNFLCSRLRETSMQLEEIALYPVERRVARFLVSALRFAGRDLSQDEVALELGMTHGEVALLLGTSRPKVTAALSNLESTGAITRRSDLIMCHPAVLARIAGAE